MEQGLNVFNFTAESLESLFASQGLERRAKSETLSDLIVFETYDEERQEKRQRCRNDFDLDELFCNLNSYKFEKKGCEIVYGLAHPQLDVDTIAYAPPYNGGDGSSGSSSKGSKSTNHYQSKYLIAVKIEARTANGASIDKRFIDKRGNEMPPLFEEFKIIINWLEDFILGRTTQTHITRTAWMCSETGEPVFLECSADFLCSSSDIDLFREARASAARREQRSASLANGNSYKRGHTMGIQAAEISAILRDQIKNFGQEAEVAEVGRVLSVGYGIARVYGLDNLQAGEMVEFPDGIQGMALNLETDNVGIVIFGSDQNIDEGETVKRTNTIVDVPVGTAFLDQAVDAADSPTLDPYEYADDATLTIELGEEEKDIDAGLVDPGTASLAGRVFCDENDDNLDNGEPGVADVTVQLLDENGTVIATTTPNGDGEYEFTGLDAGTYSVMFAADADGKTFVAQDDPDSNGGSDTVTVIVTANPVNNDPEAADDGGFSTAFGTPLEIDASALLGNDTIIGGERKVSKNFAGGVAHVNSAFNNTKILITDVYGDMNIWISAGMMSHIVDGTDGRGMQTNADYDAACGHLADGENNSSGGSDNLWTLLGFADGTDGDGARVQPGNDAARGHLTGDDNADIADKVAVVDEMA